MEQESGQDFEYDPESEEEEIEDAFLADLIQKRSKMDGSAQNNNQQAVDYTENLRKTIDVKDIYRKQKEGYQPQNSSNIGPMKPENLENSDESNNEESSEDQSASDDDSLDEKYKEVDFQSLKIPFTHQTVFAEHSKTISCIALDKAACRMATSCADNVVKFWDFASMGHTPNSFRSLDRKESQPPKHMTFNHNGQFLLICGGNAKPKIMTREGKLEFKFIKGDMYITDLKHTRGHIGVVTGGEFHPQDVSTAITSSLDSTVRLWDIEGKKIGIENLLPCKQVIRLKDSKGVNAPVQRARVSPDGAKILAACQDGSFQIVSKSNMYSRSELTCNTPYKAEITDLKWFNDSTRFLSRAQDNTMRLFDIRNFSRPLFSWYELENNHERTELAISPDQRHVVTGTSNTRNVPSSLAFFDMELMTEIARVPVSVDTKVTCINWSEKLNQIFVGVGSNVIGYFNPTISKNGAMLPLARRKKEWKPEDIVYQRPVLTPHALPMFSKDQKYRRKNMEKVRISDPKLSMKPEMPHKGPGRNGKIAGSTTIMQHLMKNVHMVQQDLREDPVEAIMRYAKEAEENPEYVDHAYKETQPVKILDYTSEAHEEQKLMSRFKKCPKCGLKVCHCYKVKV